MVTDILANMCFYVFYAFTFEKSNLNALLQVQVQVVKITSHLISLLILLPELVEGPKTPLQGERFNKIKTFQALDPYFGFVGNMQN